MLPNLARIEIVCSLSWLEKNCAMHFAVAAKTLLEEANPDAIAIFD